MVAGKEASIRERPVSGIGRPGATSPGGITLGSGDRQVRRHSSPVGRFIRQSPVGAVSALFLLGALGVALVGPLVGVGDPSDISPRSMFASPSRDLPFGADELGRNLLARLVYALRISFALAVASALLAATVGTFLGLVSGFAGGLLDEIIMRFTDVLFAFPTLLLAILIAVIMGPGISGVMLTIVIGTIPVFTRVARGPTLSVREMEYTIAARVSGASSGRILFRHVLPNISTPLLVQLAFTLSGALIAEGALSFLGLGVQPPTPSLGSLLSDGKVYMEVAPWMMLVPGIALAASILAVNLLGDELQRFTDPRNSRR
ncbi:MAG: Dipeptide transport system permease protein DppC [uncultured Thermomicrobiales bacterium]|uniref:Dipeptide transport system permease protein DppC n=1 Tax=uncultured Thermomicrobiales bacterium TaxID=1645740 RepID=A0A6J4UYS2_9BACT|nr:MAG: Dipeptide transport system permease protein DppC [uncultured Thermomicrobiales bacterium]